MIYKEKINRHSPKANCPALGKTENVELKELSEKFPLPKEYISSFQRKQAVIKRVLHILPFLITAGGILDVFTFWMLCHFNLSRATTFTVYGIVSFTLLLFLVFHLILSKLYRSKHFSTEGYIFKYYKDLHEKHMGDFGNL